MHYIYIGLAALFITLIGGFAFYKNSCSRFGSIAVLVGFFGILWYVALDTPYLLNGSIKIKHLLGLTLAGSIVYLGAYAQHRQPRRMSIFFSSVLVAVAVIVISGIGVRVITNPFNGLIPLDSWERVLFWYHGIAYRITLPADLLTFVWIFVVTYTTRWFNTLDGLVSGLAGIGALMIFFLAAATKYFQPEVGTLAIIAAGAFAGMLIWNWHPAKIRLGAGGAAFAGITLGTLAIISGSKIATTLLVLGVPVLDVLWGWVRRAVWGKRVSAGRKQLPYRLLDAGFSHRGAVIFLLAISASFGIAALFLQSAQKIAALLLLGLIAVFLIVVGSVAESVADTPPGTRRRRMILGVPVDSLSSGEAPRHAAELLKNGGQHIVTTPNPEMLVDARRDPEFARALAKASLALPDGFGLMLTARLAKQPLASRVPGVDFVFDLARLAAERGYTMYLLGAGEGVAKAAAQELRRKVGAPTEASGLKIKNVKLRIVGAEGGASITPSPLPAPYRTCSGAGMGEGGGEGVIARINSARPDILLVALGHGKQEKWIAAHLAELPSVKIAMGVGGALDFIAGRVRRAPRVFRLLGLEWLWRLLLQPWRIVRIWRAVVIFPFLVFKAKLDNTKIL